MSAIISVASLQALVSQIVKPESGRVIRRRLFGIAHPEPQMVESVEHPDRWLQNNKLPANLTLSLGFS